ITYGSCSRVVCFPRLNTYPHRVRLILSKSFFPRVFSLFGTCSLSSHLVSGRVSIGRCRTPRQHASCGSLYVSSSCTYSSSSPRSPSLSLPLVYLSHVQEVS
ncbi:unnamed protein product, partial [Laminaria digitata]